MTSPSTPWFNCKPRPAPRLRLFCFPFAGGGAAVFRDWASQLDPAVEVCCILLPGRESRLRETPFTRLEPLLEQLAEALTPHLGMPFAFFGYSLGGLICFELARRLRRQGGPGPVHLFVAARTAPGESHGGPDLHQLSDKDLIAQVCRLYDGIPPAVLQEPELMQLLLPVLRADLAVMETYAYLPGEPLDCPISAFGGASDPAVRSSQLEPWRKQTSGPFTLRMLPGNHFFLNTARPQLMQSLSQDLRPYLK